MENPYLVQALYGHKASVPGAEEKQNGSSDQVHPMRQQLISSKDANEQDAPKVVVFTPTGSNTMPLGEKTPQSEVFKHSPTSAHMTTTVGDTSPVFLARPLPSQKPPTQALKAPPERYLPPSGDYYDQFALKKAFGVDYFSTPKVKCNHCWSDCGKNWKQCDLACGICATKEHQGQGCSMIYCSLKWHMEHGTAGTFVNDIQIRPTFAEAAHLSQLGLIERVISHGDLITPILSHPLAKRFYSDKKLPKALDGAVVQNVEPAFSALRIQSTGGSVPSGQYAPLMVGNQVNTNLDPRLRKRLAENQVEPPHVSFGNDSRVMSDVSSMQPDGRFNNQSRCPMPAREESLERDTPLLHPKIGQSLLNNRLRDSISPMAAHLEVQPTTVMQSESENHIQELEDQVLELQRVMIIKDREIRRLKAENEQLRGVQGRGGEYQTSTKRPRYEGGIGGFVLKTE